LTLERSNQNQTKEKRRRRQEERRVLRHQFKTEEREEWRRLLCYILAFKNVHFQITKIIIFMLRFVLIEFFTDFFFFG